MCLNIGTPKTINFPFETNGKLMILGVPILKHFRVYVKFKLYSINISKVILLNKCEFLLLLKKGE